jgi:hypothetical protein
LISQSRGLGDVYKRQDYISKGTDNANAENFINNAYNFATNSGVKIDPKAKDAVIKAYGLYTDFMNYCNQVNAINPTGAADYKRAEKERVLNEIQKLIKSDTTGAMDQYYKYGLRKLMNAKSRDASSGINRNA